MNCGLLFNLVKVWWFTLKVDWCRSDLVSLDVWGNHTASAFYSLNLP